MDNAALANPGSHAPHFWVPHGPRARETQRENDLVRLLVRTIPIRRKAVHQREIESFLLQLVA